MVNKMKYIILILALSTAPAYANGEWQMGIGLGTVVVAEHDKVRHFGAGMATAGLTKKLGGTFWQSCAASLTVGILKEVIDKLGSGTPEVADAAATAAGCLWFDI